MATLPRNLLRATLRRSARRALSTPAGRRTVKRIAATLVGTRTGRRVLRGGIKHYAGPPLQRVRWAPLAYVPVVITFARQRRRLGPPPAPVTLGAVYSTPAVVMYALPSGRVRDCLSWLSHMWAYKVAFEVPYDHPDRLGERLRIDQPIAVDERIGLGIPPSQRLQRRLRRPPELTLLDKLATGVYVFWELEPHLALGWLLSHHPERFPAAALRMALTFDATLIGYFVTPTAPPWWASEIEGRMDGQVRRVVAEAMRALQGKPRPGSPADHRSSSNPWAAWPSDHFGSALSTAIALAEGRPAGRRTGVRLCGGARLHPRLHRGALRHRSPAGRRPGAGRPRRRVAARRPQDRLVPTRDAPGSATRPRRAGARRDSRGP